MEVVRILVLVLHTVPGKVAEKRPRYAIQHRRNFETHALTHLLALRCACLLVRCFASCLAKVADPVAKTYAGAPIDTKIGKHVKMIACELP